jgi:hypothetical protein
MIRTRRIRREGGECGELAQGRGAAAKPATGASLLGFCGVGQLAVFAGDFGVAVPDLASEAADR